MKRERNTNSVWENCADYSAQPQEVGAIYKLNDRVYQRTLSFMPKCGQSFSVIYKPITLSINGSDNIQLLLCKYSFTII